MRAEIRRALRAAVALAFAFGLLSAGPALAETRVVTSSADAGAGSLRDALADAVNGDEIVIDAGVNPVLSSGELVVDHDVTIRGQGASATTINAGSRSRIFRVSAAVTIERLTLMGGQAASGADAGASLKGGDGEDGGAILSQAGSDLTLRLITISDSAAGSGGRGGDGGLLLGPGGGGHGGRGGAVASLGTLTVLGSTFADNSGGNGGIPGTPGLFGGSAPGGDGGGGGAFFLQGGAGRSTTFENVTITANRAGNGGPSGGAAGRGGALLADGGGEAGAMTLGHLTVTGNGAGSGGNPSGGGLADEAAANVLVLRNSILAANSAATDANCSGAVGDGGANVAFPSGGCPGTFATADPNLDPNGLANNGGPTQTIAIVGAGSALNQAPAGAGCADTDQRGVRRPQGPACDIGAYELRTPICRDVHRQTRPGRMVQVKFDCSGSGSVTYLDPSEPANGALTKFKADTGTVNYRAGRRFRGTDTFSYRATDFVGESAAATVTITVSGPFPPSNRFKFGKVRLNRKKGIASLVVRVPGPGKLRVRGGGVRKGKETVKKRGRSRLAIKPAKKARRKLKRKGVVTVRPKVTYKPRGGFPRKRTKKVRLRVRNFFVPIN